MSEPIVWRPTPEVIERARITRLMRRLGVSTLAELQRRSVDDPEWYWRGVVEDLGIRFTTPFSRVLDATRGPAWPRWFPGGRLNFADNCLDRHLDAGRGDTPAIVWEGDDGSTRTLTYNELAAEVGRLANALTALGVGAGDRVGIFLPMSPEAAIATLAVVRIGAIYTPCFSGFGAQAVASRLQDSEAKVLITADGFQRRGQVVTLKETADEAGAASPSVKRVGVYRRPGRDAGDIRRRARLPEARSPVGARRAPSHQRHGAVADRGTRAHAARSGARARSRPVVAAHAGLDGGAVESRTLPLAVRERGQGANSDQQLHRRHGDFRRHPRLLSDCADQVVLVHGPHSRHGGGGLRRGRASGARRRRRAGGDEAVAGDDGRLLARPRAIRGDVLVALERRVGARRLGDDRRRRLLVHPGTLGRHAEDRGQTAGAGRGRVGSRRPSGRRRVGRHRRAARGEGRVDRLLRRLAPRTRAGRAAAP